MRMEEGGGKRKKKEKPKENTIQFRSLHPLSVKLMIQQ